MAREKEDFRDNIEQLNRLFPDYEMLSIKDVMQVLNVSGVNTVRRRFGDKMVHGKLSKVALAKYMCGGN